MANYFSNIDMKEGFLLRLIRLEKIAFITLTRDVYFLQFEIILKRFRFTPFVQCNYILLTAWLHA